MTLLNSLRTSAAFAALLLAVPPIARAQQMIPAPTPTADALAAQMRILGSNPRDVAALIAAGELSTKLDDLAAALSFFNRAQAIDPSNPRIMAGRAGTLVALQRPGEALSLFDRAERAGVPMEPYLPQRGLAYDLIGQPGYAQRDYRRALQSGSDDETVRRLALSLGISGQRDEAQKMLDPLLRRSDRAAWRARAFILAMDGDVPGAQRIASSMMSGGGALTPFFTRLASLARGDRAFAVHFGEIGTSSVRLTDARLAPALAPLPAPARPAPVAVAANEARPPSTSSSRRSRRSEREQRSGRSPAPTATAATIPVRLSPAASAAHPASSLSAAVSPSSSTEMAGGVWPARTSTNVAIGGVPSSATPTTAQPVPGGVAVSTQVASATWPTRPATNVASVSVAPTPTPITTRPATGSTSLIANASTPPAASTAPATLPVRSAVTTAGAVAPTSPSVGLAALTPVLPGSASAGAELVAPRPSPVALASSSLTIAPSSATTAGLAPLLTGGSPASSTGALTSPPTPVPVASTPSPALVPVASTAAPVVRTPEVAERNTQLLASIIDTISVPASELEVRPITAAPPPPPPQPVAKAAVPDREPAARTRSARRSEAKPAEDDAETKAPEQKKTSAKKVEVRKADAKKPEAKPDPAKAEPQRWWVQVAGGANSADLSKDWKRLNAKSAAALKGKGAYTTPLRATNRLLTGPFKSQDEAMALVNRLAKDGTSAFAWQSPAGQKITKMGAR